MTDKRQTPLEESDIACKQRKVEADSACQLNKTCINDDSAKTVFEAWTNKRDLQNADSGITVCHSPFPHCVLANLIQSEEAIADLQQELLDLELAEKNNDLYQFHQSSEDLKTAESQCIKGFREQVCTRLRDWLVKATGIPLNETIDMFCARYGHTDCLLCHDDELEGRRIAYIYYLVKAWDRSDGGTLDLFSVDENIQPAEIVKSIVPARNSLVFFEVSPGSYHQVSEVLSSDKVRWSVGGWFHGPPIQRPKAYLEPARSLSPYGAIDDDVFFDWINPVYLGVGAQGSIQEKFELDSEIELQDFIMPEKYEELLAALKSDSVNWTRKGPANKRCYDQASPELPPALQTVTDLFKSDAMFLMLSNFTGLKLHELAGESSVSENEDSDSDSETGAKVGTGESSSQAGSTSTAGTSQGAEGACEGNKEGKTAEKDKACTSRCRSEIRRWKEKCYTLVHDTDTEGSEFALDAVFYVGCSGWQSDYGGFTSYIAKGEDEELLTVTPKENALALVYRDKDTLKFVKYLNSQARAMPNAGFYDINTVYFEKVE